MSKQRDWLIGLVAAVTVLALAVLIVTAVLDAERNGRKALERLQVEQVNQLARSLDTRVNEAYTAFAGILRGPQKWNVTVKDPNDAKRLDQLQQLNPAGRTGYVLLDPQSVITNGTLLTKPVIGQHYDRPGLQQMIQSNKPAVLPASAGLTTPLPTIGFAVPIDDPSGTLTGVLLLESDISADSLFNQEVVQLKHGKTVEYSFIDTNGIVVASSDLTTLDKPADPILLDTRPGFHNHHGRVAAVAAVPSAGWHAAFSESRSEFEGDLTGPLRSALLLLVVVALVGSGLTFFALFSRLRASREEQRRLRQINEAREEFISIVSHELRTPATGQLGFLQTTLDHWEQLTDTERRQAVGQAFANARRLHTLTRDILDSSSIEAGELPYTFEVVDLSAAVHTAVGAMVDASHPATVDAGDEPRPVRADPERIQQVLANLLDNAAKNSPAGSTIEIGVSSNNGTVTVEVKDRGTGMTEEEQRRAFDKFSRGRHTTVQGTGLGLYICRKIIDAHGGRIWAASRSGGGAIVAFSLPMVADGSAHEPSTGEVRSPAS